MFFFFIFIPGSLLFLAIALLCIRFFTKGIALLNLSTTANHHASRKNGITAIIYSVIALVLASWLYWRYLWIW
ncbi:MAG TPA: hypothetical protein PK275_01285 [Chitinophagaceae bacterium]|jgi:uncharacterized membrane protein YidH (DUF202 family)|nr:hypothetical protein [Chitinophagaceae bacterium]